VAILLIGIDDTDNAQSRGTGFLARALAAACAQQGLRPRGVTRHQFLVDPRIPYTSHNSGACVAVEGDGGAEAAAFAFDFVAARAAAGADPAVCVAEAGAVPADVMVFGREATARVIEVAEALDLARRCGLALRPLGGSGLGVIGALASVGLRAEGNSGRFIDLPGLRELPDRVSLEAIERLGIRVEHLPGDRDPARLLAGPGTQHGRMPCWVAPAAGDPSAHAAGAPYETLGWVRPRLVAGGPVLPVQWSGEHDAWVPVDRKTGKSHR
jgi:hypothetical protein